MKQRGLLLVILCLFLSFLVSGCGKELVRKYPEHGFSDHYGRQTIVMDGTGEEFRYKEYFYPASDKYELEIYVNYHPSFTQANWILYRLTPGGDIQRHDPVDYDMTPWEGYPFDAMAQVLFPSKKDFFTELSTFIFKPWGVMFLLGCAHLVLPKELMSLPMRTSRFRPMVYYDDTVHDGLCIQWGVGMILGSVLWWFVEVTFSITIPMIVGIFGIFLCLPKVPRE